MPRCLICATDYDLVHGSGCPKEPCDCGHCYDSSTEDVDPDWLALARTVWAAQQRREPTCENFETDECNTPLDKVTDYNAGTPLQEKHYLCDNCHQNKAEAAQEASDADYYGGSTPTFRESLQTVRPR